MGKTCNHHQAPVQHFQKAEVTSMMTESATAFRATSYLLPPPPQIFC